MARRSGVSIATPGQQTGEHQFISIQYENPANNTKVTDVKILHDVARNVYAVNDVICQNNNIVCVPVCSKRETTCCQLETKMAASDSL